MAVFGEDQRVLAEPHRAALEAVAVAPDGALEALGLVVVAEGEELVQPLVVEPVAVVLQDQRRLVVRQRLRADVDLLRVHVRVRRVVDELGDGAEGPLMARRVGVQELGVCRRVLDPRRAVQRDALPLRRRGGALRLAAAAVAGVLVLVAALVALRRAVKGLRRVHVHLLLLDLRLAAAHAAVRRRVHGLRGRSRRRGRGRSLRRIRSLSRTRRRPVLLLDQVPATAQHADGQLEQPERECRREVKPRGIP